jgi:peptidoglycan/xylan/chitin deacetylase (PgdA/CDA1 family)
MRQLCTVTTSWDDGHPCDLRIAEMLARQGIPGTFYVPAASQFARMAPGDLRSLAGSFELGAHTLRHVKLSRLPDSEAAAEIAGSKDYIEQAAGLPCRTFAPPGGRFRARHLRMAEEAGLRGFRTVELMNADPPQRRGGIAVMSATLQVHRHSWLDYLKNAGRRRRPRNFHLYLRRGRGANLEAAFASLLDYAIARGGVLHVWGHGWEIEENGDWDLLAGILARLAERKHEVRLASNAALCEGALRDGPAAHAVSSSVVPG